MADLPDGLKENQTIRITGEFFDQTSDSVVIRIQDEETFDAPKTILLELKIDFTQKKVFRSSFENGVIGAPEDSGPFPFTAGEPFDLLILPTEGAYFIKVADTEFWTYEYRVPLTEAKYITAKGALTIEGISLVRTYCPKP